uniref:Vav-3 protein n=1 Tax=Tetraodon nigroviridis TaxID=99883 RepID=Q8UWE6_TETNG|nr:vav-3 protein [Tetraodon nigroviridis]CAD27362.1 vav-3 protein [Tetraodon nigroviridis]
MELWRQCAMWLISCNVLPANHRVTAAAAQVFDLAQTLRDGVLLCQLLNNLRPHTINLQEINLRPQMSQFLCLKNIRTFLASCNVAFAMKKSDLFDAFDLFDVRDFGKVKPVMDTLSRLSYTVIAQQGGFKPFPTEESLKDEDIYNHLEDLIDENAPEDAEDLYAAVYGLEDDCTGGKIYEDLMRAEQPPPLVLAEVDVRSCCLSEIKQTEEKYTGTLESIEKYFLNPLKKFISAAEIDRVFINIPDLVKVHKSLLVDLQDSIVNKNASNLHQIFISYKERLLIYGIYCSQVEVAIRFLDHICKEKEDVRLKLEECSKRANNGKFTLRDLLVVPMQRVLKYHLLLQLVKHTHDATDKSNLKVALDAMKDLAQFVNEVKRDNETLREIDQYQRSIENLNQPLMAYGRPKGDSEVRMVSSVDKRRQDRHIFLFDVAVIVCKRRGDNYEMKDILDLHFFKVTNNPTSDREVKKWCCGFYLTHHQGHTGFELFFKTRELKKKWLDRFEMAISDIRPEKANHNCHQFKMHTFEKTTSCSFCHLLLRGIFNQGYLCLKCGLETHKECLGQLGVCGRTGKMGARQGLPRLVVIRAYSGTPSPRCGPPLSIHEGDVIELLLADLHSSWWQGKILATSKIGFFPSDAVRPCPCVPKPVDYSSQLWFAGPMERSQAELELLERNNSTYLVRHRTRECTEYALSIKFNDKVKHIKILTKDGCFYIAESRLFKTVLDLVEYYKQYSLKEGFSSLDTTLQVPYREPSNGSRSISRASSVFSPRVLGVAMARYNFLSRDAQELSLLQGDVIRVYSKLPNGWWKGEVDGRVGWFPSTYVEEED